MNTPLRICRWIGATALLMLPGTVLHAQDVAPEVLVIHFPIDPPQPA